MFCSNFCATLSCCSDKIIKIVTLIIGDLFCARHYAKLQEEGKGNTSDQCVHTSENCLDLLVEDWIVCLLFCKATILKVFRSQCLFTDFSYPSEH